MQEISIGILANLIHDDEIRMLVSADKDFRYELIFDWRKADNKPLDCSPLISNEVILMLSTSDVQFLTQLVRFLNTITCKEADIWYDVISQNSSTFFTNVQWVLQNCLNVDLLKLLFILVNSLLYYNSDFGKVFCLIRTIVTELNMEFFSLGGLWLENDRDNELVNVLCKACFYILSSIDLSNDHECSTVEWTGISPDSVEFFFQFWFIVQTIYEVESFHTKFQPYLQNFEELFSRYENLLSKAPNSILSYTAACSFFMSLFERAQNVLPEDPRWKCVRDMKQRIGAQKWLTSTHRIAIQLCASTVDQMREQLEEALSTLRQFDREVLSSSK